MLCRHPNRQVVAFAAYVPNKDVMTKPPKMRLPYAPNRLQLVSSTPNGQEDVVQSASTDISNMLIRGVGYDLEKLQTDIAEPPHLPALYSGENSHLVSEYIIGSDRALAKPVIKESNTVFCWDNTCCDDESWQDNECNLTDLSLSELEIRQVVGGKSLVLTPNLSFEYCSSVYPASIGEIRLVESTRFVTDEADKKHTLLDTSSVNGAVLYLHSVDDKAPIKLINPWQAQGETREYANGNPIAQFLYPKFNGEKVATITILEKYTSFIVQKPLVAPDKRSIWTPASFPITWGWSVRIQQEEDDWAIVRRKLILPIVGHDGMQLPLWGSTILAYQA